MQEESICLHGIMHVSAKMFDHRTGEVTVIGDISYKKRYMTNVPILRLVIENTAHVGMDVILNDDFTMYLPYLKPIEVFRTEIDRCLREYVKKSVNVVIKAGIEEYLDELKSFSCKASLLKQAKTAVSKLKPEKVDENRLRKILEACNVVPNCDRKFVIL